jgi:hypothetical protein
VTRNGKRSRIELMRKALLLSVLESAAAALVACAPDLSDKPSATEVLEQTSHWFVGKQGLANALYDNDSLSTHVLAQICTGDSRWLSVAHRAYPTNYAHLNEDLSSALSVALVTSPSEVLQTFGADVCHEPDDVPPSCVTTDWAARARLAVEQVASPGLRGSRDECLKQIGSIASEGQKQ